MSQRVSDEVWVKLDPDAGALGGKQRKQLKAAVTVAAVLTAAGTAVHFSGVVRPRVELGDRGYGSSASTDTKIITREVVLRNAGWTTVRVTGFGKSGPGLRLLGSDELDDRSKFMAASGAQPPFDLHPGQSKTVVVVFRITDCAKVPSGRFPIPVQVDGTTGSHTIDISLPRTTPAQGGGGVHHEEEWQRAMADDACYHRL